ncbi:MAG: hypothetical protein QM783_11610 [Phycisphaerales bacterium]
MVQLDYGGWARHPYLSRGSAGPSCSSVSSPRRTVPVGAAQGAGKHLQTPHRYVFTRDLDQTPYGSRHLVLRAEHNTSHLLHRVGTVFGENPPRAGARERFARAVEAVQRADDSHILRIDEYGWDDSPEGAGPFVISDYTGDADGVVTLERLIALKGGSLTLEESKRAIEQLMGACVAGQAGGVEHGTLTMSQVHVDRRGSLLIELYGVLQQVKPSRSARADEVRSIAAIGYQLVTGLLPLKPVIPVEHMVEHIDQSWRDFFHTGLGSPGFSSAAHGAGGGQGAADRGRGADRRAWEHDQRGPEILAHAGALRATGERVDGCSSGRGHVASAPMGHTDGDRLVVRTLSAARALRSRRVWQEGSASRRRRRRRRRSCSRVKNSLR